MILIDIDMPSCCAECPLFDDNYDYPTCYCTQSSRGYKFKIHEKRMPDCPLKDFIPETRYITRHYEFIPVR